MTESESTPTPSEPDKGKTPGAGPENTGTGESAKLLEQRARELQTHIQGFGDEVRALAQKMETRKRETTVLKIMLYTGVVVMMVAFFYSSNALHEAQLKSFEVNLNHMRGMMQANIQAVEKGLRRDVQSVEEKMVGLEMRIVGFDERIMGFNDKIVGLEDKVAELEGQRSTYYLKEQKLSEVVRTLNEAVEPLAKNDPKLAGRLEELTRSSQALTQSFQKEEEGAAEEVQEIIVEENVEDPEPAISLIDPDMIFP